MVREDLNDEGVKDFEYFLEMGHHLQKINHLRIILERLRSCVASVFSQFTYASRSSLLREYRILADK
jgi:hypothetical protein